MKKKLFRLALLTALVCALLIVGASATSEPTEPAQDENGVYQISNAAEMYWFAAHVNDDNYGASAVLTADIDLNGDENNMWTPIGGKWVGGDTQYTDYTGTFDGQGHTISGLYVDSQALAGLFGSINKGGEVKNLNIANGNVSADSDGYANVGGVCGQNYGGTIANCSFSGSVTGSASGKYAYVGGVCGQNYSYDSYDDGTATITNCYNTGSVTGTGNAYFYVGGVCGYNYAYGSSTATITNCYWLTGTASTGIGTGNGTATNVESKTVDEFASGEVAWLLNTYETGSVWAVGDNGYPVLRPDQVNKVVKLTVDNIARYLNSGDKFEGEDGKVYYDTDGNSVSMPYPVTEDTTLTSKTLVTPSISGTASKVYDGTTSGPDGLSITLSGIGDADVTATATFTYDNADVGTNKTITATGITLAGKDAAKYVLREDTVMAVGKITPAQLTITAEDKSANMGDAMPTLTYRVDGLVGGDELLEAPDLTCDPDMTKAGEYPITVTGGLASDNYTIVRVSGKLVVGVSYVVTVDGEVYYVHTDVGSFELPAAPSKPGYIFMGWRSGDTTYGAGETVDIT